MIPGELIVSEGDIELNAGRPTVHLRVANRGDRPIQVGSHFHFFEVNRALVFDRAQARGMRLDIPAGTAIRFEPGDERDISLVALAGSREVYGLNNMIDGPLDEPEIEPAPTPDPEADNAAETGKSKRKSNRKK